MFNQFLKIFKPVVFAVFICLWQFPNSLLAKSKKEKKREKYALLINGYAQMYQSLSSLAWTDKIFLIKFETDKVEDFGKDLSDTSEALKKGIEVLAEENDWMDLENTGLPEIEKKKLAAVQKDRLISFLPVIGRSQSNFERTLLLSNSGALNQMQHLAQVMIEIEDNKRRRKFLKEAKKQFSRLYEADIKLLNKSYFCHDTGKESKNFR